MTRKIVKEICGYFSKQAEKMKISVSHVNAHQLVISAMEDFNNQVDRMIRSMNTS